ncbi:MAG: beta-propeller domain-containing protein [Myxococcales bacterium]|nr:MAG: beta-propeller domain-containing protein [Myxococcales bacterium]
MYRRIVVALMTVGMLACGTSKEPVGASKAKLSQFNSCDDLLGHLQKVAITDMEKTLDQYLDYENGIYARGYATADVGVAEGAANDAVAPSAPSASASEASPDFSKTNTQERDVDEADIVKTDGHFVYVLSGGFLTVIKSLHDADALSEISRVAIEGSPIEMFVAGLDASRSDAEAPSKAIVFSTVYGDGVPEPLKREQSTDSNGGVAMPATDCAAPEGGFGGCGYYGTPATKITVIDLSVRAEPVVQIELFTEASYLTSRMVKQTAHAVLSAYISGPALQLWPELEVDLYADGEISNYERRLLREEIARLKEANRKVILEATLEDWLPKAYRITHNGDSETTEEGLIAACDSFSHPAVLDGRGVIDVVSLALSENDTAINHNAIISHGGVVYASTDALYLATHPWYSNWDWWGWGSGDWTKEQSLLHKFDIKTDPNKASYVASGVVDGHVLNQFSMDEEDGYLRIATTTSPRWSMDGLESESANHLFVLHEDATKNELSQISEVRGMAPGEQIYSARFEGNLGFIVTYRQIDPLFVFDLSDPTAPVNKAELKIPGFSSYMHPLFAEDGTLTHLLTIGQGLAADLPLPICGKTKLGELEESRPEGLALNLFDVSDIQNPCLIHSEYVGGYSEAAYNHKAFSYFAQYGLLAIPVSQWGVWGDSGYWEQSFNGLKVYRVNTEEGISHLADIDHTAFYEGSNQDYWNYSWWTQVERSLTIDDQLYSISGRAVVATAIADLGTEPLEPTSHVLLPDPEPVYWWY